MNIASHFRSGFSSDNQQVSFSSAAQHSREHSGVVSDTEADIVKLRSVEQTVISVLIVITNTNQ